jgi:hypothetical protein
MILCFAAPSAVILITRLTISTLEIHFLFFMNEFREGTYTPLRGVSTLEIHFLLGGTELSTPWGVSWLV